MSSDARDCSRCAGKMHEGRHDFMARVVDEIIVVKDVPALICDTCSEVEYTLEVSREIDVIMNEFFAGRLLAKPLVAGEIRFMLKHADSIASASFALTNSRASGHTWLRPWVCLWMSARRTRPTAKKLLKHLARAHTIKGD